MIRCLSVFQVSLISFYKQIRNSSFSWWKLRDQEVLRLLHVPDHVTADFPPSYVMTSNRDFLHAEPVHLLEKFDQLGVPYRYRMYGDAEHPLWHVFHCDLRLDAAKQANDDECAFFRSLL